MATVSVCSTKGGVGKTTLVICVADELARRDLRVAIVDADPNNHCGSWAELAGDQTQVKVFSGASDATVQDMIERAGQDHDLVFVDLEGAASQTVTLAIPMSDLILMPTRTSGMDLQELIRTNGVVKRIQRAMGRAIDARGVLCQIPPLRARVSTHARTEVEKEGIKVLKTDIIARPNGYGTIHYTGVTPAHPEGDEKAREEIKAVADEILFILSGEEGA